MVLVEKKGEWLQQNITAGNPTGSNQYKELSTPSIIPTLKDIGISRDESSKAQNINKNEFKGNQYAESTATTNLNMKRVVEYRLRVEMKKGEWLQQNITVGTNQWVSIDSTPKLKDIGISRDESSKAQNKI